MAQSTGPHDCVGIQQQEVLRRVRPVHRLADDGIVAAAKPAVRLDHLERHPVLPAFLLDRCRELSGRVVAAAVLADRYFDAGHRCDLAIQGAQTINREPGGTIAADHDEDPDGRTATHVDDGIGHVKTPLGSMLS